MRNIPALLLLLILFAVWHPPWAGAYTTLIGQEINLPEGVSMPSRASLVPIGGLRVSYEDGSEITIRNYLDVFSGLIYRELTFEGRVVTVIWLDQENEPTLWLEDEGFAGKDQPSGVFRLKQPKPKEMSL